MSSVIAHPATPLSRSSRPSDAEFLRSISWTGGSSTLVEAAACGDVERFAKELRRTLRKRFGRRRETVESFAARFPLMEARASEAYRLLSASTSVVELEDLSADEVGLVVLLEGLHRFGPELRPAPLLALWRAVWEGTEAIATSDAAPDAPLHCMLRAEVLWASGILLNGAAGMRKRRDAARERLIAEFESRTDSDGTPHADLFSVLPAWLASLVRSVTLSAAAGIRLWTPDWSKRFDRLLKSCAILARPDGRLCFAPATDIRPILEQGARRSRWKADAPARRLVTRLTRSSGPSRVPGPREKTDSRMGDPRKSDLKSPPVVQSDWAKLIVSRTRWRPQADLLAVSHDAELPSLEFLAAGHALLAGQWGLSVQLDGEDVCFNAEWENVSWFSDKDADYLELQWSNDRGVTICRQALLTRGDHQLVIADAVSTPGRPGTRIDVEAALPLAAGAAAESVRPLRELRLEAGGLPVRCFPVGLPMERVESAAGSFDVADGRLLLKQSGLGGVYAPLVFDWHPRRRDALADWRRLTVTEDRRVLGVAEAAGHRVRVGGRQLLLVRSLNGSKAMRAVLGYHNGSESILARFTPEGEVEPLVLVE